MKKNLLLLVLMLGLFTTEVLAHVKKYLDGTTVVAMIGNKEGNKATQGVRVVYPDKSVYVGIISQDDVKEGQDTEAAFPYAKSCGYVLDENGNSKYILAGEEVVSHATEALLTSKQWMPIYKYDLRNFIHDDYDANDLMSAPSNLYDFTPSRVNEKWQFNANHTGKLTYEFASAGYCNQQYSNSQRAVGSNQYATKYKSYGGVTGGYVFVVSAPVNEDFTWKIENNNLQITWKNYSVGKYKVIPDETCPDCTDKAKSEWKAYVRSDCQTNYEINQIKKKALKEIVDEQVVESKKKIGKTYEFPLNTVNSKCLVFSETMILHAPEARKADIVDWFGYYQNILKIEEDEGCGFAEDRDGNYKFFIGGEEVFDKLTPEILCNIDWLTNKDNKSESFKFNSPFAGNVDITTGDIKCRFNEGNTGYISEDFIIEGQCAPEKGGYKYKVRATLYTDFTWSIQSNTLYFEETAMRNKVAEIIPENVNYESCANEKEKKKLEANVLKACKKDAHSKKMALGEYVGSLKQNFIRSHHSYHVKVCSKGCIVWDYAKNWYASGVQLDNPEECIKYYNTIIAR